MRYLKASKPLAEDIRRKLTGSGLIDRHGAVEHSDSYVYFPILSISRARIKKVVGRSTGFSIVEMAAGKREKRHKSYREALGKILTKKELETVPGRYDILGNIAILDVPKALKKKEGALADAILDLHPSVKTVISKDSAVKGKFRTRSFRHISGEWNYMATYRENGCVFRFDVRKTFFSNRLSYERSRIASLTGDEEAVVVMFAGIAPFGIEIAKAHPHAKITCIELNPYAAKAAEENIALNKTGNVAMINSDVKLASKRLKGKADRIIVPMPTASLDFLGDISDVAKRAAIVHLYTFCNNEGGAESVIKRIRGHAAANGYSVDIVSSRRVRPYSARESEAVIDYRITKAKSKRTKGK
jgi:tRNA (guanine37-N1)-methyltransferase